MKATPTRVRCGLTDQFFFFGVLFLGAACDNALPAAVFEFLPVRPSRKTFEAAFAALPDVFRSAMVASYLLQSWCWVLPDPTMEPGQPNGQTRTPHRHTSVILVLV